MSSSAYILIRHLCTHYAVEQSFFYSLRDTGLIEIITIETDDYMHQDGIPTFEKIWRINQDLQVGIEHIDVIINLLDKIENLQSELNL